MARYLGVAGATGCVLLLVEARLTTGLQLSLGYLTDNLSMIRNDQFAGLAAGADRGVLGTVGAFIAPAAVLHFVAAVRLGRVGGKWLHALAALNYVLVAAVSIMVFAGRATIVNLSLIALVSMYLAGRRFFRLRPRHVLMAALAVSSVWFLGTSFLGARQERPNATVVLEKTQRSTLRAPFADLAARSNALGLAGVSVGYFASPLPTLTFYMSLDGPGPFYGAYSYPLPARVVGTVAGTWSRDSWVSLRREIYAPIEQQGYFGNVWSTILRDLAVDFGVIGAIISCGLQPIISIRRN